MGAWSGAKATTNGRALLGSGEGVNCVACWGGEAERGGLGKES
jgi:hypothetical protein